MDIAKLLEKSKLIAQAILEGVGLVQHYLTPDFDVIEIVIS